MTPLSPEQQAALTRLHDIRLPDPIGWWPLAPGWWGLIALIAVLVPAVLAWAVLRRRTRRFTALRELEQLRARLENDPTEDVSADLAALVRRVALATRGRHLARLSEADWAEALAAGKHGVPPEVARLIAEAPYLRPESLDAARVRSLFAPMETWIRRTA